MSEGEKLQKILARAGLGSRREIEKWISEGRVKVNGKVAQLGDRASLSDRLQLDGKPLRLGDMEQAPVRILIYNKPEGEICSKRDPEGRPSVYDKLPKHKNERWVAVGRPDINSAGLLLFTTDGELANKLMHPSTGIDREYLVRVLGDVKPEVIERLKSGVMLEDGPAHFTDIVKGRGEGANKWFYVCLLEGRNREVRRLWASQDIQVNRLKRVRYGPVFMPSRIKSGQWGYLTQKDANVIYQAAGLPPRQVAALDETDKHEQRRRQNKKPVRVSGRGRRG